MTTHFTFDTDVVEKICPNGDGTATIYLKDGTQQTHPFINRDFAAFETKAKLHLNYRTLKARKDREKRSNLN